MVSNEVRFGVSARIQLFLLDMLQANRHIACVGLGKKPSYQGSLNDVLGRRWIGEFRLSFLSSSLEGRSIGISLSFSGGGYRAVMSGADQLAAFDGRETNVNTKGLGGVLQSPTYIVCLSGGSWLVG